MEEYVPTMTGHEVVDANLDTIGKVTDVLYDDVEMAPRWAVVKLSGLFGSEHFMPVGEAYVDENEKVIVPWDKSMIKGSPKAVTTFFPRSSTKSWSTTTARGSEGTRTPRCDQCARVTGSSDARTANRRMRDESRRGTRRRLG